MNQDWYQTALAKALASMHGEGLRTKNDFFFPSNSQMPPGIRDPSGDQQFQPVNQFTATSGGQGLELWKLLPAVQHLPEDLLRRIPDFALFQLNTALSKQSKVTGKMQISERLSANARELQVNPTRISPGTDDRKENLDPSRFLGGASCSNQTLWLRARAVLGAKGVVALGNYDMDSLGYGGSVTPKGWLEIHNPSSCELKLKLFHMPNVGGHSSSSTKVSVEDGSSAICIGDDFREVSDLDGVRSALNAMREAMQSALPWNRSISAICGFMQNSNYCAADLLGNPKRAPILAEFIDYILGRNALNWENNQVFLSADDLSHVWATWKGKRASSFAVKDRRHERPHQQANPYQRPKDDICRKYNSPQGCLMKKEDCKTPAGTKLRHVCNYFLPGGKGKKCEKEHPRMDHK